jgi:hypothetical protein
MTTARAQWVGVLRFPPALGSDKIGGLSLADPLQTGIELKDGH